MIYLDAFGGTFVIVVENVISQKFFTFAQYYKKYVSSVNFLVFLRLELFGTSIELQRREFQLEHILWARASFQTKQVRVYFQWSGLGKVQIVDKSNSIFPRAK